MLELDSLLGCVITVVEILVDGPSMLVEVETIVLVPSAPEEKLGRTVELVI